MSYKDVEKQRKYQRRWMAGRRADFFAGKHCKICGTDKELTIHHTDPDKKESHNVWSWSEARRKIELSKCVVLCEDCHRELHAAERRKHGVARYTAGCRCEVCRKAKSVENGAYTVRRKERVICD